jgi:hypothetical protein
MEKTQPTKQQIKEQLGRCRSGAEFAKLIKDYWKLQDVNPEDSYRNALTVFNCKPE